jgi:hypothetical protein
MCDEELDRRIIIQAPEFADAKAFGAFFARADQLATLVDQLIASDSDFAARVDRLNLCGHNLCIDALRLAKALLVNPGALVIPTHTQLAESFCIFEGCGLFKSKDPNCYDLASSATITLLTVRQSVDRLLSTENVVSELRPETIVMTAPAFATRGPAP